MAAVKWEYFVLRQVASGYSDICYFKGDSETAVCPPGTAEETVMNTFGQHGYELVNVTVTRRGDTKYYFKRPTG